MALKKALRPNGRRASLIKGEVSCEPAEGLVPGYSASGQDVWLEKPQFDGAGLVLSAVGARCGKVFEAGGQWGTVANTVPLVARPGFDAHFLWYLVNAEGFWERGGAAQPYVRVAETLERRLPFPPLAMQREIAGFLDTETARIDALVAKKRGLVALLRERAGVIRRNLVLQGFEPLAGHGSLPPGWRQACLGTAIRLQRGHDLPDDLRRDGPVPVVSSGGVSGWHDQAAATGPGVVTGRYGTVGAVHWVEREYWPLNTTLYVRDFGGRHPRWVFHLLSVLPLDIDAAKSAVRGINRNVIGQLRIPLPPQDEQQTIAVAVDEAIDRTFRPVQAIEQQIALLKERRQALITAAVTGELDVTKGVA